MLLFYQHSLPALQVLWVHGQLQNSLSANGSPAEDVQVAQRKAEFSSVDVHQHALE